MCEVIILIFSNFLGPANDPFIFHCNLFILLLATQCLLRTRNLFRYDSQIKAENVKLEMMDLFLVFSLCEYVVIMSNLGYHATSYYDYHHVSINLSSLL